jgi:uncharacterized membrane protein YeaQ/YmgE (transglycosylase-associated protein family)
MPLLELLILVVIAGITGTLAEFLIGFTPGGLMGSVIVGVLGALIGDWLARLLRLPVILPVHVGERTIELLWAAIGSLLLVVILSTLRGRRAARR